MKRVRRIIEKAIMQSHPINPGQPVYVREILEEAELALRALMMGVVPEKHDHAKCPYCVWPESCLDYNDSVDEITHRIEELFK